MMARIRKLSIIKCFSLEYFWVWTFNSSKKLTLEKYTFLNRLKLNKWIITGIPTANSPQRKYGFINCMIIEVTTWFNSSAKVINFIHLMILESCKKLRTAGILFYFIYLIFYFSWWKVTKISAYGNFAKNQSGLNACASQAVTKQTSTFILRFSLRDFWNARKANAYSIRFDFFNAKFPKAHPLPDGNQFPGNIL